MGGNAKLEGPDLTSGVEASALKEGQPFLGQAFGEPVVLVRRGERVHALGATCSHYGGPLAEGLVVDGQLRCPWHHARFDLQTGEAVGGPALNALPRYTVERRGATVVVTGKDTSPLPGRTPPRAPERVVIVGAGAAGQSAAEELRRQGYAGPVVMLGAEPNGPVDRPNLSKDYLAGSAPEEWIPLRGPEWYAENRVELRLGSPAVKLDTAARTVTLADGRSLGYGALILATGAEPIRLDLPGANLPHVHLLRTLADSRAIIERAKTARRAVVIGSSFIGLEAAAALRTRGLEVRVVGLDVIPLQKVLGNALGEFVRALHEEHGVIFHLGSSPASIDAEGVTLKSGEKLAADLVVMGVGVRPNLELAKQAGLKVDNGVIVDAHLETSAPGVFAAGDIARWPDAYTGRLVRSEHWVLAQRQGQAAARNALGLRAPFREAPFFWSQHYDVPIAYVGAGAGWDEVEVSGSIPERNCLVRYKLGGKTIACASIYRDKESLEVEAAMERGDAEAVERLARG